MLKHVGRIKTNKRKVIVAYRTLPNDPNHCVVVTTENLEAADHDFLIKLVESNSGQVSYEFAEAMARSTLSDGSNMLARFHTTGKMVRFPTDQIEMTPDTNTVIMLNELNQIVAEQKGISIEDLAIKDSSTTVTATKQDTVSEVVENPTPTQNDGVLTDEQIAANYRSQADTMFKEAKRLRDEAEKLAPSKKKTKESV